MIGIDELKEILSYDPFDGVFTWISVSKFHSEKNGNVAGCENNGYHYVKIDSIRYKAHRLAWFYTHKEWPYGVIDHINGDGLDNRICNLRDVSQTINAQNHKETIKKNGLPTGVSFCQGGFRARIQVNKKKLFLGVFAKLSDAHGAYKKARSMYHNAPVLRVNNENN